MTLARVSNQLLKTQGNDATTVAANYPITGDGSTQLPLGLAEDYSGADGESLTFNITDIDNGHQVNISGIQGSSSFNVLDGQDGANGVNGVNGADGQSVTFGITNIANGHSVTLSGAQGSTSFDVMNGQTGVDGISPTFRFVENEDKVIVFVSGAQGEESFTLYDGETHTYSAGPNINITDNTISGRDWSDEINAKLDTSEFALPNSANWDNTYNTVNSNSAQWSNDTTYTAGPNIDITDYTISGKDWTAEIESAISSVSSNYYPMTGNPSGFLTAHQDITNLPYVQNTALNYTPSTLVSGISGHELYAESANHAFTAETAKYVESGWEYSNNKITAYNGSAFSAGSTYNVTAGANINVTTAGNTFGISGKDWTNTINAASAYAASQAQGGSDFVMIDATTSYSALGLYYQVNDPGCYQIVGTAHDGSAPGKFFGYTLPTQSRLFSANCVDSAKNYTNSAISAHIKYVNYGELVAGNVTFANIRTCINDGGIVIPYEINLQSNNYKIYNYELSGVNSNTTGYTFGRFEAGGKHQYMVISSYNFGATTGCITANEKLYATPNDVAAVDRIVLVATSGDIPASGATDNKVYIVTGTA